MSCTLISDTVVKDTVKHLSHLSYRIAMFSVQGKTVRHEKICKLVILSQFFEIRENPFLFIERL